MVVASFDHYTSIVVLTVRAFSPTDAKVIADAIVSECDGLINCITEVAHGHGAVRPESGRHHGNAPQAGP